MLNIERDRDEAKDRVEKERERAMRGIRNGTKLFLGLQGPKIPSIANARWRPHKTSHVWIFRAVCALSLCSISRETETRQERECKRERERKDVGENGSWCWGCWGCY